MDDNSLRYPKNPLTNAKVRIQYRFKRPTKGKAGMSGRPLGHVFRTLTVDAKGSATPDVHLRSFRDGAVALFNLTGKAAVVQALPPNETTRLGFERIGGHLRAALASARAR